MKLKNVFQSGGSLVIPIPKEYAAALRISRGSQVIVTLRDGRLVIERAVITGAGTPPAEPPHGGYARG